MPFTPTTWLTGDIITAVKLNNAETGISNATTTADAALPKAGGTMTGLLVLSADPASALGAATKQTVDAKVSKAGDTMTGTLVLPSITLNGTGLAQTRLTSGKLEFWNGTGWKKVAGYGSGKYKGTFQTTSGTAVTALSVTGMGALKFLKGLGTGTNVTCNITIDGTLIHSGITIGGNASTQYVAGSGNSSTTVPVPFDLAFDTSFLIEIYAQTAGQQANVDWVYELV